MKTPKIKPNKNIIALGVALLIGLVSAFALKKIFDQKLIDATSGEAKAFVVANEDLVAGNTIGAENVSSRMVPLEWAQSNGVLADNFAAIDGKILTSDFQRGDIVFYEGVDLEGIKNISDMVPVGRRALTIPVDDQSSISSMLKPGNLIDLIVTVERRGQYVTLPLMEGVKVLATGNILDAGGSGVSEYDYQSAYATITLDVTIEDSQNIIQASSLGKITAVLRNPNDQTYTAARSISLPEENPVPRQAPPQPSIDEALLESRLQEMMTQMQPQQAPQQSRPKDYGVNIIYGNTQ